MAREWALYCLGTTVGKVVLEARLLNTQPCSCQKDNQLDSRVSGTNWADCGLLNWKVAWKKAKTAQTFTHCLVREVPNHFLTVLKLSTFVAPDPNRVTGTATPDKLLGNFSSIILYLLITVQKKLWSFNDGPIVYCWCAKMCNNFYAICCLAGCKLKEFRMNGLGGGVA